MAKWKILAGMHVQNDPVTGKEVIHRAGTASAIFETEVDMEFFNPPSTTGMVRKFERIYDGVPTNQALYTEDQVQAMIKRGVEEAARAGFGTLHTDSGRTAPDQHRGAPYPGVDQSLTQQSNKGVDSPQKAPQKVDEGTKVYHASLDKMSLTQLKDHAAEEEVDLKPGLTREEILKVLKVSR